METINILEVLLALSIIWQASLTFYLWKTNSKWGKIQKDAKASNLVQILENILAKQDKQETTVAQILTELSELESNKKYYFQKSSFLRFNPFEDTGGDQSFIIALLDGNNDGFVISSLHSRNGTRIYAKQITNGKELHQLSKEEKEVVERAARQKVFQSGKQ